ncbi:ABC transporter family substrate-binding protein [Saccharopolyspora shandongensis]|uniref:ABC transporter family substrate-binding protein n=1 Tax=Saccharopolyspora shandongensis TaxID=418495 RepID=UPI0033E69B58
MTRLRALRSLAIGAAALLALSGCGAGDAGPGVVQASASLNTFNAGEVQPGVGEVTVGVTQPIKSWNTATPEGAVKDAMAALDTLYPRVWIFQPDGNSLELNHNLMTRAEVVSQNPTVVEYAISPQAVWSDGTRISSDDFEYLRNVSDRKICPTCKIYNRSGFEDVDRFEAAPDKASFKVTFKRNFVDWKALYSFSIFPAHIMRQHGDLAESFNNYLSRTMPTWSGGPYIIDSYREGVDLTLKPNPKWYGKPVNLQKVTFKVISDAAQIPIALSNGEIDVATPQPQVDLPQTLSSLADANIGFQMSEGLYFESFVLNLSDPVLKDVAVRRAIFTALDRQQLTAKTVGQIDPNVKPLGSIMVMHQQEGYEDKTKDLKLGLGDVEGAKAILRDAGYRWDGTALVQPNGERVPQLTCVFTAGNALRRDECEILSTAGAALGIPITAVTTNSLGETLTEAQGTTYDFAAAAFLGSPLVATNAFRFTTGQGYNYHNEDDVVDQGIRKAIESSSPEDAVRAVNEADRALVNDVWILPLYQQPSIVAFNKRLANVRGNDTWAGLTYNIEEWGIRPGS